MPFNQGLRDRVANYEQAPDKRHSVFSKEMALLLDEKHWLGEALTGQTERDKQLFRLQSTPYFLLYHHDQAFLHEYLSIIAQLYSSWTMVSRLSIEELQSVELKLIFEDIAVGEVTYYSEQGREHLLFSAKYGNKRLTIVNPGWIQNQDTYNALMFFAHPYVYLAGNISLAKAIVMNKIPFYEWRAFQINVNKDLQKLWQGTGLESLFENDYNPEQKAQVIRKTGFDLDVLKRVNQRIVEQHNAMPALMDVIRLAHRPDALVWDYRRQMDTLISAQAAQNTLDYVMSHQQPHLRETLALRLLLAMIKGEIDESLYSADTIHQLFDLITDSQIAPYLNNLWIARHDNEALPYGVPEEKESD